MSHHIWSVCIFCLICSANSPCGSHAAVKEQQIKNGNSHNNLNDPVFIGNPHNYSRGKLKSDNEPPIKSENESPKQVRERSSDNQKSDSDKSDNISSISRENYLKKIFDKFGDGNTMTMSGFEKFIERLDLLQILSTKLDTGSISEDGSEHLKHDSLNDKSCMDRKILFSEFSDLNITKIDAKINDSMLQKACPAILYSLMVGQCNEEPHVHSDEHVDAEYETTFVWIYSMSAVFLTSACGVLALAIIPVMQKKFYKPLLQFLVALAVGTLAGDAFLHLLPHAMTRHHSHGSPNDHQEIFVMEGSIDPHDENMWKGFVAMVGLTFFFFMERLILLAGKWRKARQKKPDTHAHMKFFPNALDDLNEAHPTQCMDKYNPYPYCYQDILNHQLQACPFENDKSMSTMLEDADESCDISFNKSKSSTAEKIEDNQNMVGCMTENNVSEVNKMLPEKTQKNENITIILREHGTSHHGHSHSHGHVHAAPQNFSSVAWMVIMGDGLHNFTDGMAIGAAFSGSLAGGFSTAVAVFCHELPHELGDFAMLLKAGMTIKQALFYNLLSSLLSLLGNAVGICLGNTEYASSWVFAAAAGMFIYIALVDMIPELGSSHEDENNLTQCCLHLGGLMVGVGIMTFIAMYEQDLKAIFKEPA